MRRHIGLLLLFVSLMLSASGRAEEEPVYQGKTLGEWIDDLKDPKWEIQRAAAQSLAVFGPKKEVVSALTTALKNKDAGVVLTAAQTLGKFGLKAKEALPELRVAYKRLSASPPKLAAGKKHSQRYLKMFAEARHSIAEALILIDDHPGPEFAPILLEALKNGDADKRRDIVIRLGYLGPDAAKTTVPALIGIFTDTDERVRQQSEATHSYPGGSSPSLESFSEVPLEKVNEIRLEAVKSLGRIGPAAKPALHALTLAMKIAAPEKEARMQRIEGWPIESTDAKKVSFSFTVVTGDKAMHQACAEALGRIRSESKGTIGALRVALRDLDEGVRWAALCALLESGQDTKEFVPILLNFLRDKDAALRRVAAEALGKSKGEPKQIVPPLLTALKDTEAKVRAAAAEALGKIGVADKEVIRGLVVLLGNKEIDVFSAASMALGRFGPQAKAAVPRLLALFHDSDAEKRLMTCLTLGTIGPSAKKAITPLAKIAMDDSAEHVRLAAHAALAQIDSSRLNDTLALLTKTLQRDSDNDKDKQVILTAAFGLILLRRDARDVLPKLRALRDQTSDADMKEVIDKVIEAIEHPEKDVFDSE